MSDVFVGGLENLDGDLVANGSISARDQVELTGDNQVEAVASDGVAGYGVAMYDAVSGDAVAVATTGAKVEVNSTGVSAGDFVTGHGSTGDAGQVTTADGTGDEILGEALTGTADGTCEVMITLGGEVN
ncbi:hypothetical protein [Halorarum salinum]|uniref:DUF2190 family protein n=1 Tax=Halorarum salinum TaxID=2743089 RepID=A0A7D5QI92_9EURY|nr:hypothetical protein [Halobaculum salinum]QLG62824.1 hypothetical protein HUG12_14245 [Halobaculum salinum]